MSISQDYQTGYIKGWLEAIYPGIAKDQFNLLRDSFHELYNWNVYTAEKMMLYDVTRKVLGKDTVNYRQEIGDCVSFGAKNAIEYLICCEILMKGEAEKFRPIFPPYLYGTGRVQVGQDGGSGDGSLGSWQAKAVMEYGCIPADLDNPKCPQYSGSVARKWGDKPGPPKEFLEVGKTHPVKSAAKISSWTEACQAISNGYPLTIASDVGFTMEAQGGKFHTESGSWAHQMCCLPNTIISGIIPKGIDQIKIGDLVHAKSGKLQKVSRVFERNYSGKIVVIKPYGCPKIKVTPNHPVLILREEKDEIEKYNELDLEFAINSNNVAVKTKQKLRFRWVNAEDLLKTDLLVSPIPQIIKEDIPDWEPTINKCKNRSLPLFIDDDLAWLFGLYVADGSATEGHKISIYLSDYQIEESNRCVRAIKKLGLKSTVRYYEKYIKFTVYSAALANSFIKWFSKKENKRLPNWVLSNYNLKEILQGVFDGDGDTDKRDGRKYITNTSITLIYQLRNILFRLGEYPYITIKKQSEKNEKWKDVYKIGWTENNWNKFNKWIKNLYCMKIQKIEEEEYNGKVYNLEVENDPTYIANGVVVHNCVIGFGNNPEPYAIILNSWGDTHGHLKDFDNGEDLPIGVLRVKKKALERIINQGETFSFSNFSGFPEQRLDKALFKLI